MIDKKTLKVYRQIDELRKERTQYQQALDQDMLLYNNTSSPVRKLELNKKIKEDEQKIVEIQRKIDLCRRDLPEQGSLKD